MMDIPGVQARLPDGGILDVRLGGENAEGQWWHVTSSGIDTHGGVKPTGDATVALLKAGEYELLIRRLATDRWALMLNVEDRRYGMALGRCELEPFVAALQAEAWAGIAEKRFIRLAFKRDDLIEFLEAALAKVRLGCASSVRPATPEELKRLT